MRVVPGLTMVLTWLLAAGLGGCSPELPPEKRAVHDLRVPAQTVLGWMEEGRDIVFVDVRSEADWQASSKKLPGAVRVHSYQDVDKLMEKWSKDRLIVAYCT